MINGDIRLFRKSIKDEARRLFDVELGVMFKCLVAQLIVVRHN